jgi:hypothetical protein
MTSPRVVWILGSGFSKPLGGPLLYDLLSPRMASLVSARFGETFDLYHEARDTFARHQNQGLRLWENAEQYLDLLDQARSDRALAKLITGQEEPKQSEHAPSPIGILWAAACRAVADECSAFCKQELVEGEAWQPYRSWRARLSDKDAIITFNYDRVLETLDLPATLPGNAPTDNRPLPSRSVFKLHGSVDWVLEEDGERVGRRSGRDGTPFLATPGPTKFKETGDNGLLAPLWSAAAYVLLHADAVVFIGYRFPPTDSHALSSILNALAGNKRPYLRLFTVLGPRVHDDDTVRLKQLLHRTMHSAGRRPDSKDEQSFVGRKVTTDPFYYDLQVLPLYAQDYMATLNRGELG